MVLTVFLFAGSKLFVKVKQVYNNSVITRTLESADYKSSEFPKVLNSLLELKFLSFEQKSELYNKLAIYYYFEGEMKSFLETSGYAIFFTERVGDFEKAIYIYSLLAQYYLEIGADSAGYDMILTGRRLRNFYSITDPMLRSQALHAYGRFLVYECDFESAYKAVKQMEADAKLVSEQNSELGRQYMRRALAFKAYVLLQQGKYEEGYSLANAVYDAYFDENESVTHYYVYDFLQPVLLVKTQWALRTRNYGKAIEYNKEYGKWVKKFDFIMKKVNLTKDLLFALPTTMINERDELFKSLAYDTDYLSQNYINNYTSITDNQLANIKFTLSFQTEHHLAVTHIYEGICIVFFIFLSLLLILVMIYDETQTDGLTKLRNRKSLDSRLQNFALTGRKYSAIMVDIDNFKKLNDTYGHAFGDEVLRTVSEIFINSESHNVQCYRYGGEEILVFLEHFDLEHAVRLSEYLRHEISSLKWSKNIHVTASFGLGFESTQAVQEADENMYVAKNKGKNFTAYKKDGKQYLAERRLDIRNPIPDRPKED